MNLQSKAIDIAAYALTFAFIAGVAACAQKPAEPTLEQCREVAKKELVKAAQRELAQKKLQAAKKFVR